jgi:hypothetical protein
LRFLAEAGESALLYLDASTPAAPVEGKPAAAAAIDAESLALHLRPTAISQIKSMDLRAISAGRDPALGDIAQAVSVLREQCTWIVIDAAPPSCFSPRSLFLAQQADAVLLVLGANVTDRGLAQTTVELIRRAGGRVIGALLNRSRG